MERLRNVSQLSVSCQRSIAEAWRTLCRLSQRCLRPREGASDKAETSLFMENGGEITVSATQRTAYVGKGAGWGWKGDGGVGGGGRRCNLTVYDY